MKYQAYLVVGLVGILGVAATMAVYRVGSDQSVTPASMSSPLTTPESSPQFSPSASPTLAATPQPTPAAIDLTLQSVRLNVPFSPQAPDAEWIEPWKEGCEEVALLMVAAYDQGNRNATLPVAETKVKIAEMVEWQKGRFGSHKDIGVDEMAIVAKEYLSYKQVTIGRNITLEDIRNELRRGRPVIVPAAGQLLKNPYFTQPGPPYHVFVITGFEGDMFIANENGTKRGYNYRYSSEILEQAIHDYQSEVAITETEKAYLVLESK